MWNRNKYNM